MATVSQPSKRPTNKLSAAVIVSLVMGWGGVIVQNIAPSWFDPAVWAMTTSAAIAVVGYFFVKDRPNVGASK